VRKGEKEEETTNLLVQLSRNIVHRLLSKPQPLSHSISDFSDESLHIEMFQSGSDLQNGRIVSAKSWKEDATFEAE